MLDRRFLALALGAALVACEGGGDGGGGGGGPDGDAPNAGPSSGGGGASAQVGSLVARGGATVNGGGAGGDGGQVYLASAGAPFTLTSAAGLAAKPAWTRPAIALGANPRTVSADTTLPLSAAPLTGDDGASAATALWVKAGATVTLTLAAGGAALVVGGPVIVEGAVVAPGDAVVSIQAPVVAVAPAGGISASGAEGDPGGTLVLAVTQGAWVFGRLEARGGDGPEFGGDGGLVWVAPGAVGPGGGAVTLVLEGVVDVAGGQGGTGTGGVGGTLQVGILGDGGGGGEVRAPRAAAPRPAPALAVAAHVRGTVLAGGGGGASGGDGGAVAVNGTTTTVVAAAVDVSGGGSAGGVAGLGGSAVVGMMGGEIWLEGEVLARGGDAGVLGGASGGAVTAGAVAVLFPGTDLAPLHVSADVDVSGGSGAAGGPAGTITLQHLDEVRVVAEAVDVSGSGTAGPWSGGSGGTVELFSEGIEAGGPGPVTLAAPVRANGGLGGDGGAGGSVEVWGAGVFSSASLEADGGVSTEAVVGGAGGAVSILSLDEASMLTGTYAVRGGQGTPRGPHGTVTVDGEGRTLLDGVFMP